MKKIITTSARVSIVLWLLFLLFNLIISIPATVPTHVSAQQRDTVYQTLGTDVALEPSTLDLPIAGKIGQLYHEFHLLFKDAVGQTCSTFQIGSAVEAVVYGSHDGTRYYKIPAKVIYRNAGTAGNPSVATHRSRMIVAATGAYPFLRIRVSGWDDTACLMDGYYSGTVNPSPNFNLGFTVGTGSGNITDLESATFYIHEDGTTFTITDNDPVDIINIYGFAFASSTRGFATVTVGSYTSGGSEVQRLLTLFNFPAGQRWEMPLTGHAYMRTLDADNDIRIVVSCGGCDISGNILFRRE